VRTRQSPLPTAYPAVPSLQSKDGLPGFYAPPSLSTTFFPGQEPYPPGDPWLPRPLGRLRTGRRVVGAYPAANGYDMAKKKSPPPGAANPRRRRGHLPSPRDASFRRPGSPKAPRGAKEGRLPLEPRHLCRCPDPKASPPAPLVPPIARIPRDPADSPLGSSSSESPGGKSRRRRAYPQQIVTTRLLYCLQDPFAQLSRLQRI